MSAQHPRSSDTSELEQMASGTRRKHEDPRPRRRSWPPEWMNFQTFVALLLIIMVVLTSGSFIMTLRASEQRQVQELEAIARTEAAVQAILQEVQDDTSENQQAIISSREVAQGEREDIIERLDEVIDLLQEHTRRNESP